MIHCDDCPATADEPTPAWLVYLGRREGKCPACLHREYLLELETLDDALGLADECHFVEVPKS